MPGLNFEEINDDSKFFINPPEEYKNDFLERLDEGMGCVFLHHSIAGWPLWDEYSNIIGGKFLYKSADIRGKNHQTLGTVILLIIKFLQLAIIQLQKE